MLTPYQFASNSPINGIDLDGKEHYMTVDGLYLGQPANSTSDVIRIVTNEDAAKFKNNANAIHEAIENKCTINSYETLPVYVYNPDSKSVILSSMTMEHFMDLAHVMYGEDAGAEPDKLAHLMYNREIEFAKLAEKNAKTAIGIDQNTGEKVYPNASNSPLLKNIKKYGFIKYVIYGTFKPFDSQALEDFKSTMEDGGAQVDAGIENKNYSNFFKHKGNVSSLLKNYPAVQKIFKSIVNARRGVTTDNNPNHEGWRGKGAGKGTTAVNEITKVKSD